MHRESESESESEAAAMTDGPGPGPGLTLAQLLQKKEQLVGPREQAKREILAQAQRTICRRIEKVILGNLATEYDFTEPHKARFSSKSACRYGFVDFYTHTTDWCDTMEMTQDLGLDQSYAHMFDIELTDMDFIWDNLRAKGFTVDFKSDPYRPTLRHKPIIRVKVTWSAANQS